MKGFNFKTKKIENLHDYQIILCGPIDYLKEYIEVPLNEAMDLIESIAKKSVDLIEENKNYNIVLSIENGQDMDFDDLISFFNIFSFVLAQKYKQKNNKGYLRPSEEYYDRMLSTKYTMLHIMNYDYNFGTIQITLEREGVEPITWVE